MEIDPMSFSLIVLMVMALLTVGTLVYAGITGYNDDVNTCTAMCEGSNTEYFKLEKRGSAFSESATCYCKNYTGEIITRVM